MCTYNFSLVITKPNVDDEEAANKLYAGGCDDALFSVSGGVYEVEFDREAPSFHDAVSTAISDVNKAGIGSHVRSVVPDDLVNANTIAERSGKTRQGVRLWILGERAEGFPPPKTKVGQSPVWSWVSVAEWLLGRGAVAADVVEAAKVVARVNREIEEATEPSPNSGSRGQVLAADSKSTATPLP